MACYRVNFTVTLLGKKMACTGKLQSSVSQPPGRGPAPGPGITYTGPREILVELITNLNVIIIFVNIPHRTNNCINTLYVYAIINLLILVLV